MGKFYDQEDTARKIRKYRMMRGYKQEELGNLVYYSRYKIGKMESGKYTHSLEELDLLATALNVDLKDLTK